MSTNFNEPEMTENEPTTQTNINRLADRIQSALDHAGKIQAPASTAQHLTDLIEALQDALEIVKEEQSKWNGC